MPRNYRKKIQRGIAKPDEMLRVVRHIKSTGENIRKTAEFWYQLQNTFTL